MAGQRLLVGLLGLGRWPMPVAEWKVPTGVERPIICGCTDEDWIDFVKRGRTELGLGPDEHYVGDFSDVDVALMARRSTQILEKEERFSSLEGMRSGENRCPGGVASAGIFSLVYCMHPDVEQDCWANARSFSEFVLIPMMKSTLSGDPGDCTRMPSWMFVMEDAIMNTMRDFGPDGPRSGWGWEPRALERGAARLRAGAGSAAVAPPGPRTRPAMPGCGAVGLDACCEGADFAELEENLAAWFQHPHAMVGLPPNYRDLMTAVAYVDYPLWPSLLPWLWECKSGFAVLTLVASMAQFAGVVPGTAEQLVSQLLADFPFQELASSRFPIFGVLARVLETEETPSALGPPAVGAGEQPPLLQRACHADLAKHLHSVLVGTAALDMSLAAELADAATGAFAEDEGRVCAQQLAVAAAALGGWPLEAFGAHLVDAPERAEAWSQPTPWPVFSALHTRWARKSPLPLGRSAAPLSLSPFMVTGVRSAGFASVAAYLMRLDFNGWSLPGSALESPADPLAQDDGWTGTFDEVLRLRLEEKASLDKAQEPRVAFLEMRFAAVFDGAVNADHRPSVEQKRNMIVPHQAFEDLWARFVSSDKDSPDFLRPENRSTRLVYQFDKGLLAFIRAWKADFICWPVTPTAEAVQQLAGYDVVIVVDVWPIGRPQALPALPHQLRLWMPWEPWALQGAVRLPPDYCPVTVDGFAVAKGGPTALLWQHLSARDWRQAFPPPPLSSYQDLPEVLLFYYDPKSSASMAAFLEGQGFKVSHAAAGTPWGEYWRTLQRAWVGIMPMRTKKTQFSAGQVMADGAMAACVPTFSPRTKLLARLLMPSFLSYRSHEELAAKLLLLRGNQHWRRLLSDEVCRRLRYVDEEYLEAPSQFLRRVASHAPGDERCALRRRRQ